jgi:oxygen-independent coproporphyrinogen-3 oxidase
MTHNPYKGLYAHFPFCETKCHYCDFYSIAWSRKREGDPTRFHEALLKEAALTFPDGAPSTPFETVFFGGGTPSMSDPDTLEAFGDALDLRRAKEWTIEINPSSLDLEKARRFLKMGINRASMGVQATRDDLLKNLGRVHTRGGAFSALSTLFEAGFTNISIDLLCGVPGQTLKDLENSFDDVLSRFPITHLSCYLLTLAPHHSMYKDLPNEETQLQHLYFIHEYLEAKGFSHYEISNFCRPGKEAKHNLLYWNREGVLAMGPSGHTYDREGERRFKNISSLHKWASTLIEEGRLPREQEETLSARDIEFETWMMALRLKHGFPREWLKTDRLIAKWNSYREQGWAETHPDHPDRERLTWRGWPLSDEIVKNLM